MSFYEKHKLYDWRNDVAAGSESEYRPRHTDGLIRMGSMVIAEPRPEPEITSSGVADDLNKVMGDLTVYPSGNTDFGKYFSTISNLFNSLLTPSPAQLARQAAVRSGINYFLDTAYQNILDRTPGQYKGEVVLRKVSLLRLVHNGQSNSPIGSRRI